MTRALIFSLILVSWAPIRGPGQVLVYVGPLALLLVGLLLDAVRITRIDLAIVLSVALLGVVSAVVSPETDLINPALGLLTYSSACLLAARFPRDGEQTLVRGFLAATAWMGIGQASLGLFQLIASQGTLVFVDPSMGDNVVGTLGTNSHLFAVKMLLQGLVLAYGWRFALKHDWRSPAPAVLLAGVAFSWGGALLASALLATGAFIAAFVAWYLLQGSWTAVGRLVDGQPGRGLWSLRPILVALALAAVLGASFLGTQASNIVIIRSAVEAVLRGDLGIPKVESLGVAAREVLPQDTKTLALGTGLGRYSSRAAMILSGGYLTNQPDWMPVARSELTANHIYTQWRPSTWGQLGGSIMGMPTSSIQAVIAELGLLGSGLLLLFAASLVTRCQRRQRELEADNEAQALLQCVPPLLVTFAAMCFTDVWLEYASVTTFLYLAIAIALSGQHTNQSTPV